jgi:hypothetical protein
LGTVDLMVRSPYMLLQVTATTGTLAGVHSKFYYFLRVLHYVYSRKQESYIFIVNHELVLIKSCSFILSRGICIKMGQVISQAFIHFFKLLVSCMKFIEREGGVKHRSNL